MVDREEIKKYMVDINGTYDESLSPSDKQIFKPRVRPIDGM